MTDAPGPDEKEPAEGSAETVDEAVAEQERDEEAGGADPEG